MGVERVDYYSDDEYRQALQMEEAIYQQQWWEEARREQEQEDYLMSLEMAIDFFSEKYGEKFVKELQEKYGDDWVKEIEKIDNEESK